MLPSLSISFRLGKYLQMMTAYFIFKEASESLADCYATFSDLCEAFKEVTGEPLTIGDSAVKNSSTALKLNMSESEDLKRYNEYYFIINRAWSNKVSLYYLVL